MTPTGFDNTLAPVLPLDTAQTSDDVSVFVQNYETMGEIGLYPEEKGLRQPLRFSVEAGCHYGSLTQCHDQDSIVCYKAIVDLIEAELAKGHVDLVETLADRLCTTLLTDHRILWVTLKLEKMQAIKNSESVGIRVTRRQSRPAES